MGSRITREEARDMAEAHGQGHHDEIRREGCPECEGRELRDYPAATRARDLSDAPASAWQAHVDEEGPEPDGSRYLGGGLHGPTSR
jgi:hypothetical protein